MALKLKMIFPIIVKIVLKQKKVMKKVKTKAFMICLPLL